MFEPAQRSTDYCTPSKSQFKDSGFRCKKHPSKWSRNAVFARMPYRSLWTLALTFLILSGRQATMMALTMRARRAGGVLPLPG